MRKATKRKGEPRAKLRSLRRLRKAMRRRDSTRIYSISIRIAQYA